LDPEGTKLSERSQRQILYDITFIWNLRNKKTELKDTVIRLVIDGQGDECEMCVRSQKVQTYRYKISKSQNVTYNMVTIVNNTA